MQLGYGKPNRKLLRELRQVRADADAVIRALTEINLLPDDFPKAGLEDLCKSLTGLADGTAENCRPVLEYARNRVPQIRRENFLLEDDGEEDDEDEHDEKDARAAGGGEPRLSRGMVLDGRLSVLFASVGTALDEYRVQAQARFDDEVRGEEAAALRRPEETAAPMADAIKTIAASEHAQSELRAKDIGETEKGDTLLRRLQDGRNLALAALSLLRARRIVRRWFEGIAAAVRKLPDLIGKAARAIKVGADVARPLAGWWLTTQENAINGAIDQVESFGDALEEVGERLKRKPSRPAQPELPRPAEDAPRDPAILRAEAEAERLLKAGIEVPDDIARIVEKIDLEGTDRAPNSIARWQDVARFQALRSLEARHADFDLSQHGWFLAGKPGLSHVGLSPLHSDDLGPIGSLTSLTSLELYTVDATDLGPLANLTRLTSLSLHANSATDLDPLGSLTSLTSLSLHANSATDLDPLGSLTSLTSLSLHANSATDLDPLGTLTSLNSLGLSADNATHLGPLENLTSLTSLVLLADSATDLSLLESLTALTELRLFANRATDLTLLVTLTSLTSLTSLTLFADSATDLTLLGTLTSLTSLTSLTLFADSATNLGPLETLPALTSLSLSADSATDLGPLGTLTSLNSLWLSADNATHLGSLENLTALTSLEIYSVGDADLKSLGRIRALEDLSVRSNGDFDCKWLAPLDKLRKVTLEGMRVLNESVLDGVEVTISQ